VRQEPEEGHTLDLGQILRSGDHVLVAQAAGEPTPLVTMLLEQRIPGLTLLMGLSLSGVVEPRHAADVGLTMFGGLGTNKELTAAGVADVLPLQLSHIPGLIGSGAIPVDAVLMQVSPADAEGMHSFGVTADFIEPAIRAARVVVAEVNEHMPWTEGATRIAGRDIDYRMSSSRPLAEVPTSPFGPLEQAIADHVGEFVADRSVLQIGIGKVPDAIMKSLGDRRDLGVHTGLLCDSMLDLIEAGVITNSFKPVDTGTSVTGVLMGSRRLYDWAHHNPALAMRPVSYTHSPGVLQQIPTFTSINSALQVDLTGQVNAETLEGRYVGAVGGQVDFVRAGTAAPHGRSIIALPSSAAGGSKTRVVPRLGDSVVTSLRTDVDVIVTEYGAAQLRGCTLRERARRMVAIAHPAHRDDLERASRLYDTRT
jgi:acyl-CoA hydrolase